MPRPCAVEVHARCYKESHRATFWDATALRRGGSRSLLQGKSPRNFLGCHGLAPWRFTLAAKKSRRATSWDATALRRGGSRSWLQEKSPRNFLGCHGLAPWRFTLAATRKVAAQLPGMPRPCAVEVHARCYKKSRRATSWDATALRRGGSRSLLQEKSPRNFLGCHGLAPWRCTLAAKNNIRVTWRFL